MDSIYNSEASRARYEAYSRLQASAVAFGEKLPIREIVAVGGRADGKSSLLEALLGFRFNIREVRMGTRRPLVLQMIHDPDALEPRCRLQEYRSVIEPISSVAERIRVRTHDYVKKAEQGESDNTPDKILAMVRESAASQTPFSAIEHCRVEFVPLAGCCKIHRSDPTAYYCCGIQV